METENFLGIAESYRKLIGLCIQSKEIAALVKHLKQKIRALTEGGHFSTEERECLNFLLGFSTSMPQAHEVHREEIKRKYEANKILTSEAPGEFKLRETLKLYGHSIKESKRAKADKVVSFYNWMLRSDGDELPDGSRLIKYHHEGRYHDIRWRGEREKKINLIRIIRTIYFDCNVSEQSVMQHLYRRGVRGLPMSLNL
jgi:hypothetical protein